MGGYRERTRTKLDLRVIQRNRFFHIRSSYPPRLRCPPKRCDPPKRKNHKSHKKAPSVHRRASPRLSLASKMKGPSSPLYFFRLSGIPHVELRRGANRRRVWGNQGADRYGRLGHAPTGMETMFIYGTIRWRSGSDPGQRSSVNAARPRAGCVELFVSL